MGVEYIIAILMNEKVIFQIFEQVKFSGKLSIYTFFISLQLSRCRDIYAEAKARLAVIVSEKKRKLRRDGRPDLVEEDSPQGYSKALWITVTKV